jgi:hypothetical protein
MLPHLNFIKLISIFYLIMFGTLLMKKKCAAFIIMHHLIKQKEKSLKTRRYWIKHLYQTTVFPFRRFSSKRS